MPRESFYPDTNEPHIHLHSHRTLVRGSLVYRGTLQEVLAELQRRGDARSLQMAQYIQANLA